MKRYHDPLWLLEQILNILTLSTVLIIRMNQSCLPVIFYVIYNNIDAWISTISCHVNPDTEEAEDEVRLKIWRFQMKI
jgi:hypothetical protein